MKTLVIGGTLFIGRRLVARLLERGHEVAVLHRRPGHSLGTDVQELVGDRNDGESVRRALSGQSFDLVFDNVYDWRRGTSADQVVATARACGGGLSRYVFMSSVAAYGDGLSRSEEDPLAPDDHPETYVRNKAASERVLLRMHGEEGFPAVTLRPPFVYGPGNPFYREAFFWDRIADGRPVIVPGDGRRLMHFVYVGDLVEACLLAAEVPAAAGEAFNIAHAEPIMQLDLVHALARAAGRPVRLAHVPRERIVAAGGDVFGPENLYFGVYYDLPSITERIDKARRVLGFQPSDFGSCLEETYRWYLAHHRRPPPDYRFEDSLIATDQSG